MFRNEDGCGIEDVDPVLILDSFTVQVPALVEGCLLSLYTATGSAVLGCFFLT